VIESALRREIFEELGLEIDVMGLLRIDAIPYIPEEPGPYRLDFYFRCAPRSGFATFRRSLRSGQAKPCSPEIRQMRLVPMTDLSEYDLFSSDARFLTKDLPRHEPTAVEAFGATSLVASHYSTRSDTRRIDAPEEASGEQPARQGSRRTDKRGRSKTG
jgi:hypothetical protein